MVIISATGFRSMLYTFNRNLKTDFSNGEILRELDLGSVNIDYSELDNQMYFQTIFRQRFLIGAGAELKHIKIKSETLGTDSPVFDNSNYFTIFGTLKLDTYDNRYFPSEGWLASGEIKSYVYSSDYKNNFARFTTIKGEVGTSKKIIGGLTIQLEAEGGFRIGESTINSFDYVLGGYGYYPISNFRYFYGYDFLSLAGNSYLKGVAALDWEFLKKNHLNFTANFANIGNNMYDDGSIFSLPEYSGYAFGYGMETIIGPIEVKHSWSPDTRDHYTWFSVGFRF